MALKIPVEPKHNFELVLTFEYPLGRITFVALQQ